MKTLFQYQLNLLSNKKYIVILAFLLSAPVFLSATGIYNNDMQEGRGFPVSMLLILFLLPVCFKGKLPRQEFRLVFLFFISILSSVSISVFIHQFEYSWLFLSYLVPCFIGLFSWLYVKKYFLDHKFLFFKVFVYTVSFFSFIWSISQFPNFLLVGRGSGSVFNIFSIYQVWVYWPTIMAIAFCICSALPLKSNNFLRIILLFGIVVSGAREPFALIVVFFATNAFMRGKLKDVAFIMFASIVTLIAVYVDLFGYLYTIFPDLILLKKISFMLSGEQSLDAGRFDVLKHFDFSNINLFFGTYYSTYVETGSAHNQYIEIFYRGGLLGLGGLLWLVIKVIFIKVKEEDIFIKAILISVFIATFNINVPLRAPYVASSLWFFMFLLFSIRHKRITHTKN